LRWINAAAAYLPLNIPVGGRHLASKFTEPKDHIKSSR